MEGDNVTFTLRRADLSPLDKTIYVVAFTESNFGANVTFEAFYTAVPPPVIDNSYSAKVAVYTIVAVLLFIVSVNGLEASYAKVRK
jgi:hypothetical protein